jgi:hypothetical protein
VVAIFTEESLECRSRRTVPVIPLWPLSSVTVALPELTISPVSRSPVENDSAGRGVQENAPVSKVPHGTIYDRGTPSGMPVSLAENYLITSAFHFRAHQKPPRKNITANYKNQNSTVSIRKTDRSRTKQDLDSSPGYTFLVN